MKSISLSQSYGMKFGSGVMFGPLQRSGNNADAQHVNEIITIIQNLMEIDSSLLYPSPTAHQQPAIHRIRIPVRFIFDQIGPRNIRQNYRMTENAFWRLHSILEVHLRLNCGTYGCVNSPIPSESRLSAAIRFFAGGSPCDIMSSHGMGKSEVYNSVWMTVNAINATKQFNIVFPTDHTTQKRIAQGFQQHSVPGFSTVVGAIDGVIIWTEKPTKEECIKVGVGESKFFCFRKNKFGLNMQAICDSETRFLDISISHAASSSDYLAFVSSDIHDCLKQPGFLSNGLHLIGDGAYGTSPFMAPTYRDVTKGTFEDGYNYHHSQVSVSAMCFSILLISNYQLPPILQKLRNTIERAFGLLMGRWGVLRRALSKKFGLKRIISLTIACCKMHNYCVDLHGENTAVPRHSNRDNLQIVLDGGFSENDVLPQLLDGGEHFDDAPRNLRRSVRRILNPNNAMLPREKLRAIIQSKGLLRPDITQSPHCNI